MTSQQLYAVQLFTPKSRFYYTMSQVP